MSFLDRLDRCDGPPCPRCGCQDVRILELPRPGGWWSSGRARCKHCAMVFSFRELPAPTPEPVLPPIVDGPAIAIESIAPEILDSTGNGMACPAKPPSGERPPPPEPLGQICPKCGGRGLVRSTQKQTQYRVCKTCGERWKTQKSG